MSDLSNILKKQYAAQQEQALAELKSAYEKNTSALDEQAAAIPQQYEAARNDMAAQSAIARKNFNEQAAATGMNTGTAGQAELARSSAYQSALAGLHASQQNAQQALERDKLSLQAQYENAIAAAKAENAAGLQGALYQEMLRRQSYGGSGGGGGDDDAVSVVSAPTITTNKAAESAAGNGVTSFSNVKRTIASAFQLSETDKALRLIAGSWSQLNPDQQDELAVLANQWGYVIKR